MIIAVDYDGTLEINGKMNTALIERLQMQKSRGAVIILWSCREGKRLRDAVARMTKAGLRPDYVNCNCPQAVALLGHDSRKIYADVYLDDKNGRW